MKFYIVETMEDGVIGCELTQRDAKKLFRDDDICTMTEVDCPVNAETIRLLLGQYGGHATSVRQIVHTESVDLRAGYDAAALGATLDSTKPKAWRDGWNEYHADCERSERARFV